MSITMTSITLWEFLGIWSAASSSAIMEIADSSDKVGAIGIYRLSLS